jgi:catechol 2,3-dioxygenase-like lactoylglutathione lyase family enzyme
MITGAHAIVYSRDPEADRAFLREVLGLPHVDVGGGWLIFGLPPAEVAVHPAEDNGRHELYFLCDDVAAFVAAMQARNVACGPVTDQRWGLLTEIVLPGGGKLGVYQPRHARPPQQGAAAVARQARPKAKIIKKPPRKPAKRAGKRPAKAKRRR